MKNRFTEEQIIKILEEGRNGMKVADVCRKHEISIPTYYLLEKQVLKYDGFRSEKA